MATAIAETGAEAPLVEVGIRVATCWGSTSTRHLGSFPLPDDEEGGADGRFATTLACNIMVFTPGVPRPTLNVQAHSGLATCLRPSPAGAFACTTSACGEVAVWALPRFGRVASLSLPGRTLRHCSWSPDGTLLALVAVEPNPGAVVLAFHAGDPLDCRNKAGGRAAAATGTATPASLRLEWSLDGEFDWVEWMADGHLVLNPHRATGLVLHRAPPDALALPSTHTLVEKEDVRCRLLLPSMPSAPRAVAVCTTDHRLLVMAPDLSAQLFSMDGLRVEAADWSPGGHLVVATSDGAVQWLDLAGTTLKRLICELRHPLHLSVVSDSRLWLCSHSGVHRLDAAHGGEESNETLRVAESFTAHHITACGLDLSPDGQLAATGDFGGTVRLVRHAEGRCVHSFQPSPEPVRSVCWFAPDALAVGGMNGVVHAAHLQGLDGDDRNGHVKVATAAHDVGSAAIAIKFAPTSGILAVGTQNGEVVLYRVVTTSTTNTENEACPGLERAGRFLAHPPATGPQDLQFGQLGKHAEVWTLALEEGSAGGSEAAAGPASRLATGSEDQRVRVWSVEAALRDGGEGEGCGALLATLEGHRLAVTSVVWTPQALASISDDCTVRLYHRGSLELWRTLSTTDVHGWHTLTYAAALPATQQLACVTQHGYLAVWDLPSGRRQACVKIHRGSVEGLACDPASGLLATVSSDCALLCLRLVPR